LGRISATADSDFLYKNAPAKQGRCICASEMNRFFGFELQLELIGDEGDELGIRGFSLGIADGIAEKSLKCIQIASVPGYFNRVTDCSFHTAGSGLEGFRHLGVQDLGDGVGVLSARLGAFWGCTDLTLQIKSLNVDNLLLSLSSRLLLLYGFENMIAK